MQVYIQNNDFIKEKELNITKTNTNMCILMRFKIQSDQPRITRNALKSQFSVCLLNDRQEIHKNSV